MAKSIATVWPSNCPLTPEYMEEVADWAALQRMVCTVPRAALGYTTNFFVNRDQFDRWCRTGPVQALATQGALLLLRADRDFHHVYHVAADPSVLASALGGLPCGTYTADLVGREASLEQTCAIYDRAGFRHHSFLVRMGRGQTPSLSEDGNADLATVDDIAAIMMFLERLLDRFTEQLPDQDELRQAAQAGRLLLVHRETRIVGMLMYDTRGQSAHLRFWHVDHDARGDGVGRRLMESFLARCAQMRQIALWVIGDNDRSIAIYRHYGFATDGMIDRIMLLHKEARP